MEILKKEVNKVPVTIIKTKKFKSIAGTLYFKNLMTKEKMTYRNVLRNILIESCEKYNTPEKLYIKALENYDAYYSSSLSRYGNYQISSFSFSSLVDKYTKKGNLDEVVDTFCEIVFKPLVKNDEFDKETFEMIVDTQRAYLERIKESSDAYAEIRTYKNLNQNKAYTYMSEIKYLDKMTPKSLYQDYVSMINNSEVELILAGDIDFDNSIIEKITSFIKNTKTFDDKMIITNDDEKEELVKIKEDGSGTQNILNIIMYLKNANDYELNYVAPLYRIILGGGSFSRLFKIIREENSLAYYSFARYEKDDSLMAVMMGIEKENYDKAFNLTCEVIDGMKKIDEKELGEAKKTLISSLLESQDSIYNMIGRYHNSKLFNLPDIDLFIEKINDVKINEIENFATKLKPNVSYFLEGEKTNG